MADDETPLVDELNIKSIKRVIYGGHGRIFSAAGRESPIAEFTSESLILHPPDKPYTDASDQAEVIKLRVSDRGVLLDDLGEEKRIPGGKYKGNGLWWLGEHKMGTTKFLVAWFDEKGKSHKLFLKGEAMTVDQAFRLRNRTHDGELSAFPDVSSDADKEEAGSTA